MRAGCETPRKPGRQTADRELATAEGRRQPAEKDRPDLVVAVEGLDGQHGLLLAAEDALLQARDQESLQRLRRDPLADAAFRSRGRQSATQSTTYVRG